MTHDFVVRVLKNSYRVYLENHFAAQKTKTHDDEKKKTCPSLTDTYRI
ncbi:MAG: hypothetical protein ACI90V_002395 [Bacillariaceae sp.]|jgi:hypothetical protein